MSAAYPPLDFSRPGDLVTWPEVMASSTAKQAGLANTFDAPIHAWFAALVSRVIIDPLRRHGIPHRISSFYRGAALRQVFAAQDPPHPAKNPLSQHALGQAVDLNGPQGTLAEAEEIYNFIKMHLPFDVLLLERRRLAQNKGFTYWVHVSLGPRMRRQAKYYF